MTARILIREIILALLIIVIMALYRSLEDLLDAGEPLRIALIVEGAFSVLGGCEDIHHVITIIVLMRDLKEGWVICAGCSCILTAALAASRRVPGLLVGGRWSGPAPVLASWCLHHCLLPLLDVRHADSWWSWWVKHVFFSRVFYVLCVLVNTFLCERVRRYRFYFCQKS